VSPIEHIHLLGIGGSAMAPLAGMLKERGYRITGSDSGVYPPASTLLSNLGIAFFDAYHESHLQPHPDLVVVGNALSRGNPEVEYVLDSRIPYRSMPQVLEDFFLPGKYSIVISGTHGKTTTTAMAAWIFQVAGRRPNLLLGGVAENFGRSYALGGGDEFILEGDEYDTAFFDRAPKFFHYHPQDLVITSVEYEHADIFASLAEYELAFRRLVHLVPRSGRVILWGDGDAAEASARRVAEKAFCPVATYGFGQENDWIAGDLLVEGPATRFRAVHQGEEVAEVYLPATGRHNVLNALAAIALAHRRGIPRPAIEQALASFRNVRRRMDIKGEARGVLVVDDFAHHPTAIRATIEAARARWPGRRLWAIPEPRSNSMRRKVFESVLPEVLAAADRVLIGPVSRAGLLHDSERLSPQAVAEAVVAVGKPAEAMPSTEAIVARLAQEAVAGDVVLVMSNGSFDGLCEKLLTRLGEGSQPAGEEAHRQ
jgi:UDP-N-acetylmuramate: L-alanyl-gamma-D-glutamyl-meso-diaminopimelate ligase